VADLAGYLREFLATISGPVGRRLTLVQVDDATDPRELRLTFEDGCCLVVGLGSPWNPDGVLLDIEFEPAEPGAAGNGYRGAA
jgi:hypothetical protein